MEESDAQELMEFEEQGGDTSDTSANQPAEMVLSEQGNDVQQLPASTDDLTGPLFVLGQMNVVQQPPASPELAQSEPLNDDQPPPGSIDKTPESERRSDIQQPPASSDNINGLAQSEPLNDDQPPPGSIDKSPESGRWNDVLQTPASTHNLPESEHGSDIQQPPTSPDKLTETSPQKKDKVYVSLSVQWLEGKPQKFDMELEKALQTWANKNKVGVDFNVLKASDDRQAVISLNSSSVLPRLSNLSGQTLTGRDGKKVQIKAIRLLPETYKEEFDSKTLRSSSVSDPRDNQMQLGEPSRCSNSEAFSTGKQEMCICPDIGHFWYVNHIYKEEMKRIERENGVDITAEVHVTFKPRKGGNPQKASDEFTRLVQTSLSECSGSTIALKYVDPEEWSKALKTIQKNEQKLLLTLSSEEMTVYGSRKSQDLFSTSLLATQSEEPSSDTSQISMNINDPLVNEGLIMDDSDWRLMITSFSEQLAKMVAMFDVDFKESSVHQGKVNVKACYKRSGGNTSMESHAIRALLRLHQKIKTSPMNFARHNGASGFSSSLKNSDHQSEGASSGPLSNGDREDQTCPICMDVFTNKTQLKCKHEFCEDCLEQSKSTMGSICPVCKDVFGVIEGDQPEGTMNIKVEQSSLPGFSHCGTIIIDYHFPSGTQMKKHPKPGKSYHGTFRTAYLPDNHEGREVLQLLKKAFDQKLIFTIGTSRTTGMDDQVTWNDIHHKTSKLGGPHSFGYPDPDYLGRVKEELKAKGIK